jgi:MYXO-CTERM domain-containing protein
LRDPQTPAEPPLRSDYAVAAWGLAIVALILLILRRLLA